MTKKAANGAKANSAVIATRSVPACTLLRSTVYGLGLLARLCGTWTSTRRLLVASFDNWAPRSKSVNISLPNLQAAFYLSRTGIFSGVRRTQQERGGRIFSGEAYNICPPPLVFSACRIFALLTAFQRYFLLFRHKETQLNFYLFTERKLAQQVAILT